MKCSYCGSSNTTPQLVNRDKTSRNALFFTIPFLITMLIFAILGFIAEVLLLSLFVGFIFACILGFLGKLVSKIIPKKHKVIFICHNCGKITKAKK